MGWHRRRGARACIGRISRPAAVPQIANLRDCSETAGLVWLFLKECTSLETYLATLRKLNQRVGEFDTLLPGHGTPLDAAFIGEQIVCAENILSGAAQPKPYPWFGGTASLCQYKRAMIAYDPTHVRARP
jgi:hypothetical protein